MRVRNIIELAVALGNGQWIQPGESKEVADEVGDLLIAAGQCEQVEGEPAEGA